MGCSRTLKGWETEFCGLMGFHHLGPENPPRQENTLALEFAVEYCQCLLAAVTLAMKKGRPALSAVRELVAVPAQEVHAVYPGIAGASTLAVVIQRDVSVPQHARGCHVGSQEKTQRQM